MVNFNWGQQYVLMDSHIAGVPWKDWTNSSLNDTFAIPFGFVLLFICIQALHGLMTSIRNLWAHPTTVSHTDTDEASQWKDVNPATFYYLTHQAKENSGWTIFAFNIARMTGCLLHERRISMKFTDLLRGCPEIFMTLTFFCCSGLAILSMSVKKWTTLATRYNTTILLSVLAVYAYRDIWPLGTYTEQPKDTSHDHLLWYKIALVALTGAAVPLFIPRRYIPVDPKNPMAVPNVELTCSIFSFIYYFYLDPVILKGYRVDHLKAEELPPICDTDQAKNLVKRTFPFLDPYQGAKKGHLFFGMMRAFRPEYTIMTLCLAARCVAELCSPIAINRILSSLSFNGYIFAATRALVRAEALITELVFRTHKETKPDKDRDSPTVIGTPETASIAESSQSSESNTEAASTSSKGKAKQTPGGDGKKDTNLIGKINNLVTTDLGNITDARDFLMLILSVPLQIIICTIFLYKLLGWSTMLQSVQRNRMKMTDARVQEVTEVVGVLRMVKLFGWESRMSERVSENERGELLATWKYKVLSSLNGVSNSTIPTITMVATYATYTVIMKQSLTPSIIFSSVTVFGILRMQLFRVSWQISSSVQGKVSLDRISDFLRKTELLDAFVDPEPDTLIPADELIYDKSVIGFNNASFSWSLEQQDGSATPLSDCINLIIGEMHFIRTNPDSWFNLPRDEGVAYAAQESWVQNATIRDNILFGSSYDEVLHQCGLERDMELFDAGDMTEVGEKGITLRVTLARAIYSPAKVILLDDVLAALDVHTSAWIVNKCFKGDLVQGRTVLLVTHNVPLVAPVAHFIVSIGQDGVVRTQGVDPEDALAKDPVLAAEEETVLEEMEIENQAVEALAKKEAPNQGKLVLAEEIAEGHVTWESVKLFLSGLGGDYPFVFYSLWIAGFMSTNWMRTFQTWFLGYWGSQYETHDDPSEVRVSLYLSLYSAIVLGAVLLNMATYFFYVSGSMRASRVINKALVNSVLTSTLRWLDETPTARIIARCTQDIRVIDGPIADTTMMLTNVAIQMVTNIGVIMIFIPLFVFPGLAIAALGFYLGNIYLKAQLSVKREMSNAKSPVLAHFSAAISGIVSVRAYGAQVAFKAESLNRIDHYVRIARISYNLNRWIGVRIDLLGQLFTVSLASYLVYGHSIGASNTGFTLNMAVDFCLMILWWVRIFNEFEVQSNSLERIKGYIDIQHEPLPTEEGKAPAAWPTSGNLVVENLSARYSQTGPTVLHELSFRVESGERVGVGDGRTGSGKSTLTLALLRCIVTEGTVYYDGKDTNKLNLEALRSNVTIIPQTNQFDQTLLGPHTFVGTLRKNLDPFEQHDDATLNDALRSAGLFSLQDEEGEARITLDSNIYSGGSNLSVGEKQIIALARAMVRGSKLLILDEDYKTDALIQTTLRQKLPSDVTVITVAHRLQTIMDADKIMVLNEGRIAEFDSPKSLLQKDGSMFKALVDESGDKDALYAVAEGKAASSSHQL
ncbi:hypothetical protein CPB84DRAFT_1772829 [Gymnopilus junonius]|uniref:P-loop containing nucleoside triphosphate hydrolase protein n=1 Tax=Gymnopilus junonius TaxID=109634 RepID=A0A9P5NPW2_GYMJU|nr:hypothetical protein CPB84DRAFT_1772829 [Gymnopilus junonius]